MFFPQKVATANYFGTLGDSGRTSLILTPGQYRSDAPGVLTNTERAFSHMSLRLFYTGDSDTDTGANRPTLAAAPSIGAVTGTSTGNVVTFSATVTGDPSAGVQQVWVTWTGGAGAGGVGQWSSVDLVQDANDSTHWTGTLTLAAGQAPGDVRFLVQAANGVGAVGLDTAERDGYRVTPAGVVDTAEVALSTGPVSAASPYGVQALVTDASGAGVSGRTVQFTVSRGGTELYSYFDLTGADGTVPLGLDGQPGVPSGVLTIKASVLGETGQVLDTATLVLDSAR